MEIEYKQDGTLLQGFLVRPDAVPARLPGVLVVHEWWGHNEHARDQARRLAAAGYVGFALDLYGKGKVATHPGDAEALMKEASRDRGALRARFDAGLELLKLDPHVDPGKIAAIGYCFGGSVVLDVARSGADLAAVVSFHGLLGTTTPARKGLVKARILVLTGAEDPMVPPEQVAAFEQEMRAAEASYKVISYASARHAFTNPGADKTGLAALGYDAEADRDSWAAMLDLLAEVFG